MLSSVISPSTTSTFINDQSVQSIFAEMKYSFAAMNATCENVISMLQNLIHERKEQAAIKIQKAFRKYSLKLTIRQSESIDQNALPQTEVEHPIAESLNTRAMFHEIEDAWPLDPVACVNVDADLEIEASLCYATALSSLISPVIDIVITKPTSREVLPGLETLASRNSGDSIVVNFPFSLLFWVGVDIDSTGPPWLDGNPPGFDILHLHVQPHALALLIDPFFPELCGFSVRLDMAVNICGFLDFVYMIFDLMHERGVAPLEMGIFIFYFILGIPSYICGFVLGPFTLAGPIFPSPLLTLPAKMGNNALIMIDHSGSVFPTIEAGLLCFCYKNFSCDNFKGFVCAKTAKPCYGYVLNLSHAAIMGFVAGAAITIALQQLKGLLGIQNLIKKTDINSVMSSVWGSVHHGPKLETIVIRVPFLVFLLITKYIATKNKIFFWVAAIAPMISVIMSTFYVYITKADKQGVSIMQPYKKGVHPLSASENFFSGKYLSLGVRIGGVASVITLTKAIAIGRTFAAMKDYSIDGKKEVVAMGAMNIISSLTSCYVATSSSRSAVNYMLMLEFKNDGVVIGEALKLYAIRWLPDSVDALVSDAHARRNKSLVETIVCLLPCYSGVGYSCSFLLKLLKMAILVEADVSSRDKLMKQLNNFLALFSFGFRCEDCCIFLASQPKWLRPDQLLAANYMHAVFITTIFYICCACFGYAAFGNQTPGNFLTEFGFCEPYWLIDFLQLVGGYQIYSQPTYSVVDRWCSRNYPNSGFVNNFYQLQLPLLPAFRLNMFRIYFQTALSFWPAIYFPVEMYFVQKKIATWSTKWIVTFCLTQKYTQVDENVAFSVAIEAVGISWANYIVAFGALKGITRVFAWCVYMQNFGKLPIHLEDKVFLKGNGDDTHGFTKLGQPEEETDQVVIGLEQHQWVIILVLDQVDE